MPITKWKSQSEKATYCMISNPTAFWKGRTMTVKWLFLQGNIVNWLPQDPSKIPIQPGSSSISYFSVMFQTLKNKI